MAVEGYITSLLGGLPQDLKRALTDVFRYTLPNSRLGPFAHQTKSESFNGYYVSSTTAASTGEFSIPHGMGRTPYLCLSVLPLDTVNARTVPLTVTRAADGQRIYLKTEAGSTSAAIALYLE